MENQKCIFCDRKNFSERLIYENDFAYVIASLGQITDGGYLLIIPKMHVPCMGALTGQTQKEVFSLFFQCLALSTDRKDRVNSWPATVFEHGIVGQTIQHAHLHLLPSALDLTTQIKKDFPTSEIQKIDSLNELSDIHAEQRMPYLFWITPDGKMMVCWNPPAPAQYLRTVAANLLNRPERADWRTMDQELDTRLWKKTVSRMRLYFFQALA